MADVDAAAAVPDDQEPKKAGKGLLIGLLGALVMGGVGFYASYSGLLPSGGGSSEQKTENAAPKPKMAKADLEFIPLDPLVISLGREARANHLQFGAQLEITPGSAEDVKKLMPRILDVLNTYLRAVDERELETPSAMLRLRAQMLRRVQIVTGEGKVKDLLVTEFVLN